MPNNRTTHRTFEILEFIASNNKPCTLAITSKALEIPKTSTYDIISTLCKDGYLQIENKELSSYVLGVKMFQLGYSYLNNMSVYQLCQPYLIDLANKLNKTILVASLVGDKIIYFDKREPSQRFVGIATEGATQPAHSTGLGKAILAALPNKKVLEIMGQGPYVKKTKQTVDNYEDLIKELDSIRERDYCIDNCENEDYIYCIAFPVLNHLNEPVAGISATGMKSQYDKDTELLAVCEIKKIALDISHKLGFEGDNLFNLQK